MAKYDLSKDATGNWFARDLAVGRILGHAQLDKFGYNGDVGNSEETIWDQGGLYGYLASASKLKISSADAADTSDGTGARTVTVTGLNGNWVEYSETVTLTGQTAVETVSTFWRVNRMKVVTAGSGGKNAGKVYAGTGTVTNGVPANIYATIAAGMNQTLMALWTVPAGRIFLLEQMDVGTFGNASALLDVRLYVREFGSVFQIKRRLLLTVNRSAVELHHAPLYIPAKADIEVRAVSSTGTLDVDAAFSGTIIESAYLGT